MHINEMEKINWPTMQRNIKINVVQGSIPVYCKIFSDDRVNPSIKITIREIDPHEKVTCLDHKDLKHHDEHDKQLKPNEMKNI